MANLWMYLANRCGIPRITTSGVTVNTTNVSFTVPSLEVLCKGYSGLVLVKVSQSIPEGTTTTLPVILTYPNGGTQAVTIAGNAELTVSDVTTGIHIAYYESNSGTFQFIA